MASNNAALGKGTRIVLAIIFIVIFILANWGLIRKGIEIHNDGIIAFGILTSFTFLLFFFMIIQNPLFRSINEIIYIVIALIMSVLIVFILFSILTIISYQRPSYDEYFWSKVGQVCKGKGINEAMLYDTNPRIHKVISKEMDIDIYGGIPISWFPESLATTELVICNKEEYSKVLQTCHYQPNGSVTRYQYEMEVQLVSARSGKIIAQKVFVGGSPGKCPLTISSSPNQSTKREQYGSRVSKSEIINWVKLFVELN